MHYSISAPAPNGAAHRTLAALALAHPAAATTYSYTDVIDPNAGTNPGQGTYAFGINVGGDIDGLYLNSNNAAVGFVATPKAVSAVPEPSTLAPFAPGARVRRSHSRPCRSPAVRHQTARAPRGAGRLPGTATPGRPRQNLQLQ